MKALIMDDNKIDLLVLSSTLMKLGFDCVATDSILNGLTILNSNEVDLIILDLSFPEYVSGMDFLKMRLETPKIFKIPVFIISASSDFDSMYACFKDKANEFLIKPVQKDLLKKLLTKVGFKLEC